MTDVPRPSTADAAAIAALAAPAEPAEPAGPAALAAKPQAPSVPMKRIEITVPDAIPANLVQVAVGLGMQIMQAAQLGRAVISFPEFEADESGRPTVSVGQFGVLILDPKDIERLINLGTALNNTNQAVLEQQKKGSPVDALVTTVAANKAKDNASRQAEAGDKPAIIVP